MASGVLIAAHVRLEASALRHRAQPGPSQGLASEPFRCSCTQILLVTTTLHRCACTIQTPAVFTCRRQRGMRPRFLVLKAALRSPTLRPLQWRLHRCLMTLAVETSCDDTSVAIVEKACRHGRVTAQLHFHKKVTSNNSLYQGVHPLVSLQSHQESLAILLGEAIRHLPLRNGDILAGADADAAPLGDVDITKRRLPDFISVTRGPGMRSNLFTGLDTAKGLAVAWQVLHACLLVNM